MNNYKWLTPAAIILFIAAAIFAVLGFSDVSYHSNITLYEAQSYMTLAAGTLISGFVCICTKVIADAISKKQ